MILTRNTRISERGDLFLLFSLWAASRGAAESMRVFIRRQHECCADRPLPLSSQTFCETEDVLRLMQEHVAADGLVDTLYIEFENMRIPVCHEAELRIVAQLAAAYNNAIIEQNVRCQKDLYFQPYSRATREAPAPVSPASSPCERSRDLSKCMEKLWDEEMHGEQVVYDEHYEQNADIDPWMLMKTLRAAKFGEKYN
jgi:hypothetical protein